MGGLSRTEGRYKLRIGRGGVLCRQRTAQRCRKGLRRSTLACSAAARQGSLNARRRSTPIWAAAAVIVLVSAARRSSADSASWARGLASATRARPARSPRRVADAVQALRRCVPQMRPTGARLQRVQRQREGGRVRPKQRRCHRHRVQQLPAQRHGAAHRRRLLRHLRLRGGGDFEQARGGVVGVQHLQGGAG